MLTSQSPRSPTIRTNQGRGRIHARSHRRETAAGVVSEPVADAPASNSATSDDVAGHAVADIVVSRERGPMRPSQLRSVRERHSRRSGAHGFRIADVAIILLSTVLIAHLMVPGPLANITLADAGPLALAARMTSRLVRSLRLYQFGRNEGLVRHLCGVAVAVLLGAATMGGASILLNGSVAFSDMLLPWSALLATALMTAHLAWYLIVLRWRRQGWLTPNVVVVGATIHAEDLISDAIARGQMNILGIFDDRLERSPHALLGVPVLGDTDALLMHKITPFVDLIVVAVDPMAAGRVRQIMSKLATLPNPVTMIFDPHTHAQRSAAIDQMADAPLAPLDPVVDSERRAFSKRLQDLFIGVPALLLLTPVLLVIGLAVRFSGPGPVLFRQRRHGFNNEEIVVWKFRTMRHETADHRAERQVVANDDRVTPIGRILRSTSLDELPQLINVIKGEMSLVGPRPHAIGMKTGDVESAQLVADYAHRHRIKPGMTGYAAIKGSRGPMHLAEDVSRRVELDVEYIDRQSFWLDLRIMLMTVPSVLGDRGSVR